MQSIWGTWSLYLNEIFARENVARLEIDLKFSVSQIALTWIEKRKFGFWTTLSTCVREYSTSDFRKIASCINMHCISAYFLGKKLSILAGMVLSKFGTDFLLRDGSNIAQRTVKQKCRNAKSTNIESNLPESVFCNGALKDTTGKKLTFPHDQAEKNRHSEILSMFD